MSWLASRIARRGILLGSLFWAASLRGHPASDHGQLIEPYTQGLADHRLPRSFPLLAIYKAGGGTLGFVAARHETDPQSATFRLIGQGFAEVRPQLVILEGFPSSRGVNPPKVLVGIATHGSPGAESYFRGEGGRAGHLAQAAGIPILGGEPDDRELFHGLTQLGFAADDILNAELLKVLVQDHDAGVFSSPSDPAFAAAFAGWAHALATDVGRQAPSRDVFAAWYIRRFGTPIASDTKWSERVDPGRSGLIAELARAQGLLRDRHLFALSTAQLKRFQRVLVVYGGSHLTSMWRALQAEFGTPTISV